LLNVFTILLGEYDPNRYILNFLKETREEIERRKIESQTIPIQFVDEHALEVDINDIYQPGSGKHINFFRCQIRIFYCCFSCS